MQKKYVYEDYSSETVRKNQFVHDIISWLIIPISNSLNLVNK